jgi:hypothetical protein
MTNGNQIAAPVEFERRDVIRAAQATRIAGSGAVGLATTGPALAQRAASQGMHSRDNAPLGARLQGVQHFGVTVQNMDRAIAFYTEMRSSNEVIRDGDFHGEPSTTQFWLTRRFSRTSARSIRAPWACLT